MNITDPIDLGWTSYLSATKRVSEDIKAIETTKNTFKTKVQELAKTISNLNADKTELPETALQSLLTAANNAQMAFNLFGTTFSKLHDADAAWIKSTGLVSQDERSKIVQKNQDLDFEFMSSMMMALNGAMSAVYTVFDKQAALESASSKS